MRVNIYSEIHIEIMHTNDIGISCSFFFKLNDDLAIRDQKKVDKKIVPPNINGWHSDDVKQGHILAPSVKVIRPVCFVVRLITAQMSSVCPTLAKTCNQNIKWICGT